MKENSRTAVVRQDGVEPPRAEDVGRRADAQKVYNARTSQAGSPRAEEKGSTVHEFRKKLFQMLKNKQNVFEKEVSTRAQNLTDERVVLRRHKSKVFPNKKIFSDDLKQILNTIKKKNGLNSNKKPAKAVDDNSSPMVRAFDPASNAPYYRQPKRSNLRQMLASREANPCSFASQLGIDTKQYRSMEAGAGFEFS